MIGPRYIGPTVGVAVSDPSDILRDGVAAVGVALQLAIVHKEVQTLRREVARLSMRGAALPELGGSQP